MDTQQVSEIAEDVAAEAKNRVQAGKEAVNRYAAQAREYGVRAKSATEDTIHRYPFWSVLAALGAGLALGFGLSAAIRSKTSTSIVE